MHSYPFDVSSSAPIPRAERIEQVEQVSPVIQIATSCSSSNQLSLDPVIEVHGGTIFNIVMPIDVENETKRVDNIVANLGRLKPDTSTST